MVARVFFLGILLLGFSIARARADHLSLELSVQASTKTKAAEADISAIGAKPKARGILEVGSGKTLTVKYSVTSIAKNGMAKDVVIHFFVVKIDKVGQTAVPKLDKDVAAESALTMDFKPKDTAKGEMSFTIEKPGVYLLRLETIGAAQGVDGHEHFAALDVVVK
jgi:hypothetical protein